MDTARPLVASAQSRARVSLSKESMAYVARLDAAEAAVRRQDHRTAMHLLHRAPALLQGTGDGRVLELMALCATHGRLPTATDAWGLWQRCLAAYQEMQDGAGMQRAHRALGLYAYGRGELVLAGQELRRAQRLLERQHRPEACIVGLCQQSEVAMAQGRVAIDDALTWADDAVGQSQRRGAAMLEARARLMRARALCLVGQVADAALDMLWAERVAAPQVHVGQRLGHEALQLMVVRAETLLLLGHPRRAATCLGRIESEAQAIPLADALAHYQLLTSQAFVDDQPHLAHAAGLAAHRHYVACKQSYHRAACEVALARTARRLGHSDVGARIRALGAARLERWPLIAFAHKRAQEEVSAPHHHVLGAVKTPWMRAVGKIDVGPEVPGHKALGQSNQEPGFMHRLTHAIGRLSQEDAPHAELQNSQRM